MGQPKDYVSNKERVEVIHQMPLGWWFGTLLVTLGVAIGVIICSVGG
jgi:hypothetical protein